MENIKFLDGGISDIQGFKSTGIHSGLKVEKKDLSIIFSQVDAVAAGVLTNNKVKAAPVIVTKEHLTSTGGHCRAIIANSANANACTGEIGIENAKEMAKLTAKELNIDEKEVMVASTGIIGVQLPMDKVSAGIKEICEKLEDSNSAQDAAEGITTTDTFIKEVLVEATIGGKNVKIGGIAKGSGMINPDMATMLSFVVSDVDISAELLQEALNDVAEGTYNMISVDGDTSTNDMALVMANGLAKNEKITEKNDDYYLFKEALFAASLKLAELIVRDGEGATKFITVNVINADSVKDARKAAKSITTSSLVKTAIFGEDANWGRVIVALGYSGIDFNLDTVSMYIGSDSGREQMMENGMGLTFNEEKAKHILMHKDIELIIDLNMGTAEATAWTCDFSYDYVKLNADYRS